MAALRLRRIGIPDPRITRKLLGVRARHAARPRGRPKVHFKYKFMFEIIATTPEEAQSSLFQKVGDLFVFVPEGFEPVILQNFGLSDQEPYRRLWTQSSFGFRHALILLKVAFPKWANYNPAGLLDQAFVRTDPPVHDKVSGEVVREGRTYLVKTYEDIALHLWIPKFIYQTKAARKGLFRDRRHASFVALAFGITLDLKATSQSWLRSDTPDMQSEELRSIQVDEKQYEEIKKRILDQMEHLARKGRDPSPDWERLEKDILPRIAGLQATEIARALRRDIEPIVPEMLKMMEKAREEDTEYLKNRPPRHRSAPWTFSGSGEPL